MGVQVSGIPLVTGQRRACLCLTLALPFHRSFSNLLITLCLSFSYL